MVVRGKKKKKKTKKNKERGWSWCPLGVTGGGGSPSRQRPGGYRVRVVRATTSPFRQLAVKARSCSTFYCGTWARLGRAGPSRWGSRPRERGVLFEHTAPPSTRAGPMLLPALPSLCGTQWARPESTGSASAAGDLLLRAARNLGHSTCPGRHRVSAAQAGEWCRPCGPDTPTGGYLHHDGQLNRRAPGWWWRSGPGPRPASAPGCSPTPGSPPPSTGDAPRSAKEAHRSTPVRDQGRGRSSTRRVWADTLVDGAAAPVPTAVTPPFFLWGWGVGAAVGHPRRPTAGR